MTPLGQIAAWKMVNDPDNVIEAFTTANGGKAHALNTAIRTRATGELIMCLDGDSISGARCSGQVGGLLR